MHNPHCVAEEYREHINRHSMLQDYLAGQDAEDSEDNSDEN